MIGARAAALAGAVLLVACGTDGPDDPGPGVPVAQNVDRQMAIDAAVDIRTHGCGPRVGFGTGSVVADGLVVTAAHVVAGAESIEVIATDTTKSAGEVVLFDPDLDLALVRTVAPIGTPLSLWGERAAAGEAGVVVLPRLTEEEMVVDVGDVTVVRPADIRTTDIYLDRQVARSGFEIEGSIDPGDSGAMVVLPGGGAGIVWARSNVTEQRAWAIDLPTALVDGELDPLTTPVDIGPCL